MWYKERRYIAAPAGGVLVARRGAEPALPGVMESQAAPATSSPNPQSRSRQQHNYLHHHQLDLVQFEFETNVRSVYKLICMSV